MRLAIPCKKANPTLLYSKQPISFAPLLASFGAEKPWQIAERLIVKNHRFLRILLIVLLIFPSLNYADDNDVAAWTRQVLISTLSIDYTVTPENFAILQENYMPTAWEALEDFVGDQVNVIRAEKLTLHPVALGPATVVRSGFSFGIHYWRVNQSIAIPELNMTIDFSVIVIKANNPPYLIQNMTMSKHDS